MLQSSQIKVRIIFIIEYQRREGREGWGRRKRERRERRGDDDEMGKGRREGIGKGTVHSGRETKMCGQVGEMGKA